MAGKSRQASNEGERLAALTAAFEQFEKYEHDRWHKLNNDLQMIVNLPRDLAKMEGRFRGEVTAVSRAIEKTVADAIEKALGPVNQDVADLKDEVDALKEDRQQLTGAKMMAVWVVQTIIAALSAFAAVLALGGKTHP